MEQVKNISLRASVLLSQVQKERITLVGVMDSAKRKTRLLSRWI